VINGSGADAIPTPCKTSSNYHLAPLPRSEWHSDYIIKIYDDGSVMIRNADTEAQSRTSAPTMQVTLHS